MAKNKGWHFQPDVFLKRLARYGTGLRRASFFFVRVFILVLLCVLLIEVATPSLDFSKEPGTFAFRGVAGGDRKTDALGAPLPPGIMRQVTVSTSDSRTLSFEVREAPGTPEAGPRSLTVVIPGMLSTHQILGEILPSANNLLIVYNTPRRERMTGPAWPSLHMLDAPGGIWRLLTTNPLTKWYSIHEGMHEAPLDVSALVQWATASLGVDPQRINLIGVGSGALVATAAADRLRAMGAPVRALALVYPPADMVLAVRDDLYPIPMVIGMQAGRIVSWFGRRLALDRHLPQVAQTSKQLIIPLDAFELASYAAMPAVHLAGANSQVTQAKFAYSSLTSNENVVAVRNIVIHWLHQQGAIY